MSSSHVRLTACETGRAPVIGNHVTSTEVQRESHVTCILLS